MSYLVDAVTSRRKILTLTKTFADIAPLYGSSGYLRFPFASALPAGAVFVGAFLRITSAFDGQALFASVAGPSTAVVPSAGPTNWGYVGFDPPSFDGPSLMSTGVKGYPIIGVGNVDPETLEFVYQPVGWVGASLPELRIGATSGGFLGAPPATVGSVTATIVYDDYT